MARHGHDILEEIRILLSDTGGLRAPAGGVFRSLAYPRGPPGPVWGPQQLCCPSRGSFIGVFPPLGLAGIP